MKIIRYGTPDFKFDLFELKDLKNKPNNFFLSLNCNRINDDWYVIINEDKTLKLFIDRVEKPIGEYGFVSSLDGSMDSVEGMLINHGWFRNAEDFASVNDIPKRIKSSPCGEC